MKKAIYGFSGDPITYGHIDIIQRALNIFGELLVGIGVNPAKKYFFAQEERRKIAEESLKFLPQVEVIAYQGLLVDYAYENDIKTVVRGIRNSEDLNYELMLHQVGESQKQAIDTVYFPAKQALMHISSGAVKALQLEQGLIHEFVPLCVKQKLEEKISQQTILSVTGEIGMGKSYVSQKFKEMGKALGVEVHVIDIDKIGHQILGELEAPIYKKFRAEIVDRLGAHILQADGFINRKELGKIIFDSRVELDRFNTLLYKPLLLRLRRELYGKKGLILLDTALVSESQMSYLSNNHVILVSATREVQEARLRQRGYTVAQMQSRMNSQYTQALKEQMILDCIRKGYHGKLWKLDNSQMDSDEPIWDLFRQVMQDMKLPASPKYIAMRLDKAHQKIHETLILEPIVLEDHSRLLRLMQNIYPPAYGHYWQDGGARYLQACFSREGLAQDLNTPDSCYYFVQFQQETVGIFKYDFHVFYQECAHTCLKLHRIYLAPPVQGKGIGRSVLKWLEQQVRGEIDEIWLEAMASQPNAIRFYEKQGYQIVGTKQLDFLGVWEVYRGMVLLAKKIPYRYGQ